MKIIYTKKDILDLLVSMDMAINPETYVSTNDLGTEDFLDLAYCKAEEYNLTDEFEKFAKKHGKLDE